MFHIYTRAGELSADSPDEVIALLRQYPFLPPDDYFTVGRDEVEYLEAIVERKKKFVISHIAPGKDDSEALARNVPYETVEAVMAAFCRGDANWKKLLPGGGFSAMPASAATVPGGEATEMTAAEDWRDIGADARPIEPQSFGCTTLLVIAAALLLIAVGMGIVYFGR